LVKNLDEIGKDYSSRVAKTAERKGWNRDE
jgi:ribosome-binding protein aMBF1 (putative translation factor)